ncbi:MAG: ABC transporter permease [Acidimicrobiales bacterium]
MTSLTYLRLEIVRTFRNWRFLIFSLGFPLVLFLTVAGSNRHAQLLGIPFPLYYLAGMASWGTMVAVISGGARISVERSDGWTRQMRITPLSTNAYFGSKVLNGYLMAVLSIAVLYLAGFLLGVRLSAGEWLTLTGLLLVGLIPFAVGGILLGHLVKPDSLGPAMGGGTSLLALLGGAWGPIFQKGILLKLTKGLPSYWLVQAGKTAVGGKLWPAEAWIVLAAWTLMLAVLAVRVYLRDTARV